MLIGNDMRLKSLIESNWGITDCHYGKEGILQVVLDTVLVDGRERVIFILSSYEPLVVWQTHARTDTQHTVLRVRTPSSCATQTKSLGSSAPAQFPPT